MAEARLETEWDRTSWILTMIHNSNCAKGSGVKDPAKFNPMRATKKKNKKEQGSLKDLRAAMKGG